MERRASSQASPGILIVHRSKRDKDHGKMCQRRLVLLEKLALRPKTDCRLYAERWHAHAGMAGLGDVDQGRRSSISVTTRTIRFSVPVQRRAPAHADKIHQLHERRDDAIRCSSPCRRISRRNRCRSTFNIRAAWD